MKLVEFSFLLVLPARLVLSLILVVGFLNAQTAPAGKTQRILWIMTDGLRWQEVFQGAELSQFTKENRASDPEKLKQEFWRETAKERRELLMPFFWSVIAKNGQI